MESECHNKELPTACVAAPHTLPMNHEEPQNQRVGCVRYARTRLLDWRFAIFKFAFVEAATFQTASNTNTVYSSISKPLAHLKQTHVQAAFQLR